MGALAVSATDHGRKVTFRSDRAPGDVIGSRDRRLEHGDKSIRSHNAAIRWVQNPLSLHRVVPPDENDLSSAYRGGGQTVQCRNNTGADVDGKS